MTLNDPTEITIERTADSLRAVGNIGFDDYFGGIGCFGTMEIAAWEDWLTLWKALGERDGVRCYSARELEGGQFELLDGVRVEPYDTAFVLTRLADGTYTFATDAWRSTDEHPMTNTENWVLDTSHARILRAV